MTDHPYVAYEGAPTWDILDRAIRDLEDNQDLQVTTARPYVIGYLCRQLAALGQEPPGTIAVWRILRGAGWDLERDPAAYLSVASTIAGIADAGDAGHVTMYLHGLPQDVRAGIPETTDDFLALAEQLVVACERANEHLDEAI